MVLTASGGQSFSLSAAQRNERNSVLMLQNSFTTIYGTREKQLKLSWPIISGELTLLLASCKVLTRG
jgi:hypothetical protein